MSEGLGQPPTFGPGKRNSSTAAILLARALAEKESSMPGISAWQHLLASIHRYERIPLEEIRDIEETAEALMRGWPDEHLWYLWIDLKGPSFAMDPRRVLGKPFPFQLRYEVKSEIVDIVVSFAWRRVEELREKIAAGGRGD